MYGTTSVKVCSYCDTLQSRVFLSLTPSCLIYFFPIRGKFFTFIIRLCTNVTCATQGLQQYSNNDSLELTIYSCYDCHYDGCLSNEAVRHSQFLVHLDYSSFFCSLLSVVQVQIVFFVCLLKGDRVEDNFTSLIHLQRQIIWLYVLSTYYRQTICLLRLSGFTFFVHCQYKRNLQ